MNHSTKVLSKSSLIVSTSLLIGLSYIQSGTADSTHFTDEQVPLVSAETTPVETKAAEFKKVIEDFEEKSSAKNDPIENEPAVALATSKAEKKEITKPEINSEEEEIILASTADPKTEATPKAEEVIEEAELEQIEPDATVEIIAEQDPLPILDQKASTEAQIQTSAQPRLEVIDYSAVQNNRAPLGIVESNRDLNTQKWYLFSSARRGIKSPNDVVEIVSIVDEKNPIHRSEEVKALLVEMGIKPENIKIVTATGDESQNGKIYIFGN